mgnify:CR=1 FL=1
MGCGTCRCAGLCVYEGASGMISVRLSEPLLKFRPRSDLVDTLLVRLPCVPCRNPNSNRVQAIISSVLTQRALRPLAVASQHELIHAFLFVTQGNTDRDGHGPMFRHHMKRINQAAGSSITVYHSFHDEVEQHLTHVWKCDVRFSSSCATTLAPAHTPSPRSPRTDVGYFRAHASGASPTLDW